MERLETTVRRAQICGQAGRGYERVILETGERHPEALMLDRSFGYRETEVFEPYAGGRWSVCFEKRSKCRVPQNP
jgi:hypothetical protein